MRPIEELRQRHWQEIQALQAKFPHNDAKEEWFYGMGGVAYDKARVCLDCGKQLERVKV